MHSSGKGVVFSLSHLAVLTSVAEAITAEATTVAANPAAAEFREREDRKPDEILLLHFVSDEMRHSVLK